MRKGRDLGLRHLEIELVKDIGRSETKKENLVVFLIANKKTVKPYLIFNHKFYPLHSVPIKNHLSKEIATSNTK